MPTIIAVDRDGHEHRLAVDSGLSLMEVLRDNDMDVMAICGGCCSCATCHVYVDGDWLAALDPQAPDERELVQDSPHFRDGPSRLSCQIRVTDGLDGLRVTLAPED
ncbi:2Fe-2S iron-sulfur cluster-binding protein [Niveispirillum sp.]|uniref:2Fe-2S iron-sulfur cluster-binding protein n=1 Tax=Niveispirillum sp. TaxID=1917217 RepID=UPI001B547CDE|nr:2Fe-2S iron-sulfur cluster-binding protein [Niveispirillum sp.]MBP7338282.1 (2Fe-2S)-binding protein [Niveispirillum sp.]